MAHTSLSWVLSEVMAQNSNIQWYAKPDRSSRCTEVMQTANTWQIIHIVPHAVPGWHLIRAKGMTTTGYVAADDVQFKPIPKLRARIIRLQDKQSSL